MDNNHYLLRFQLDIKYFWNKSSKIRILLYHIYQPFRSGSIWHKVIFKRSLTGLKSEFSFSLTSCLTKAKEPSLPYYLPIAGGRIIGFIPFPRVLVLCEMQSVSSRIWTRVAVFISYDDNHYTTGTSLEFYYMPNIIILPNTNTIEDIQKQAWYGNGPDVVEYKLSADGI